MSRVKDLTGMKFGRLTVIGRHGSNKRGDAMWLCRCECGNEVVVRGDSLRSGDTTSCGCLRKEKRRETVGESHPNWKGGITPISDHLRRLPIVKQWKEDAKENVNYTCQLTGKNGGVNTHHLKAFNSIVIEAHELYNINIKQNIGDYTEEELKLLKKYVENWHKDSSNAVVLCNELHNLFHSLYGKGDNTPEQFEEFKTRYLNGEFDTELKEIA